MFMKLLAWKPESLNSKPYTLEEKDDVQDEGGIVSVLASGIFEYVLYIH